MSIARVSLLVLCVAAGCGSRVEQGFDPGPPANPRADATEAPVLRGAVKDGVAAALAIDPVSGSATPFGPPLPVDPALYLALSVTTSGSGRAVVSAQGSFVIDRGIHFLAPSLVLVGDGTAWRELYRGEETLDAAISDDGGTVYMMRTCAADPSGLGMTESLLDAATGKEIWSFPCSDAASLAGVAPDGEHVAVLRGQTLLARDRAGTETLLADLEGTGARLQAVFPSTVVVRSADGSPRWLHWTGHAVDVPGARELRLSERPGFRVSDVRERLRWTTPALSSRLAVQGARLVRLEERDVTPVLAVPPGTDPGDVLGYVDGRLVLLAQRSDDGAGLAVVGPAGTITSRYEDAPDFHGAMPLAQSLTGRWPWVLVRSSRLDGTLDGDILHGDMIDRDELWLLGDPAKGLPARAAPPLSVSVSARPMVDAFPSHAGAHVLVSSDGALRSVALADGHAVSAAPGWTMR